MGGVLRWAPEAAGRGPSLSVSSAWGTAESGVEHLWSLPEASGLAGNEPDARPARVDAELGYGMDVLGGVGLLTPYAAVALPDPDTRVYRLGSRFDLGRSVSLGLEGTSRQVADAEPEQQLILTGSVRW